TDSLALLEVVESAEDVNNSDEPVLASIEHEELIIDLPADLQEESLDPSLELPILLEPVEDLASVSAVEIAEAESAPLNLLATPSESSANVEAPSVSYVDEAPEIEAVTPVAEVAPEPVLDSDYDPE